MGKIGLVQQGTLWVPRTCPSLLPPKREGETEGETVELTDQEE